MAAIEIESVNDLPAWITRQRFPRFIAAVEHGARGGTARTSTPGPISGEQFREPYRLHPDREIVLGRGLDCSVCRIHPHVEMAHCVIVRAAGGPDYWIADCHSHAGTWVNRNAVSVARVESGDLIQLGPFAFTLNGTDGFLVPVAGIPGAEVHVENLDVGRLRVERLTIPAGQFVAVTGASGAGKSTLLKAIAGLPEFRGKGFIYVDGRPVASHWGWYRSILGYLSQDAILHDELSPLQALKINQRLRRRLAASERGVAQVLRALEVPEDRWESSFRELSGGEQKRVRIASELLARPHLLLLDEPASGLDPERERGLMRLLRVLAMQGCTVLVVTHGHMHSDLCDQQIRIEGGALVESRGEHTAVRASAAPRAAAAGSLWTQWSNLCKREAALGRRRWLVPADAGRRRASLRDRTLGGVRSLGRVVGNPLVLVPVLFAVALHLTLVGSQKREMLGFFAVLASLWLGSSLSLLSIVGERPIFDHESFLYLRIGPYVLAKFFWLSVVSVCQTGLFFGVLWSLRSLSEQEVPLFYGNGWVFLVLAGLGCAGVALGLLISALAGHRKEAATLLLPLVMIGQIVFSVQVAGDGGFLDRAYGSFHLHRCNVAPRLWADRWSPEEGGWISRAASREVQARFRQKEETIRTYDRPRPLNAVERARILDKLRGERILDEEDSKRPNTLAVVFSYFTLSRYGDIALRSFAFDEGAYRHYAGDTAPEAAWARRYDYYGWRHHSYWTIAGVVAGMVLATIGILKLQVSHMSLFQLGYLAKATANIARSTWYSFLKALRRLWPQKDNPQSR